MIPETIDKNIDFGFSTSCQVSILSTMSELRENKTIWTIETSNWKILYIQDNTPLSINTARGFLDFPINSQDDTSTIPHFQRIYEI